MTPDMSVADMLDSFIYIVKGPRVINRKAINWGEAYWLDERQIRRHVYTVSEMRAYFRHRISIKIITHPRFCRERKVTDPFNAWLTHPNRFIALTLSEAMRFADMAARGQIPPRINMEAI